MGKPSGYWDIKENCINEAKKYNRRSDLKKFNNTVYNKLCKRDWLIDACQHMESVNKPNGYWTKEICEIEARKYNTKKDFEHNCKGAYVASIKNKWINEVCQHMLKKSGNRFFRLVYVYEFGDNSAYIGLTYNIDRRQRERDCDNKDPVTIHIKKTGLLPIRKILVDLVDVNIAAKSECYYIKEYQDNGWNVLNRNIGGSIGGGNTKWTKEKIMGVANNYKFLIDFKRDYEWLVYIVNSNKWFYLLDNLICFVNRLEYNYTEYYELINNIELKNITTRKRYGEIIVKYNNYLEFKNNNKKIWNIIYNRKWFDLLEPLGYIKGKTSLKTGHSNVDIKLSHKYNDINIVKVDLKGFSTITQLAKENLSLYQHILKNGWKEELLNDLYVCKQKPVGTWTKEMCHEVALLCRNKKELGKKYPGAYWKANKYKWLDDICGHMVKEYKKIDKRWIGCKDGERKEKLKRREIRKPLLEEIEKLIEMINNMEYVDEIKYKNFSVKQLEFLKERLQKQLKQQNVSK